MCSSDLEGSQEIQPPDRERQGERDSLESLCGLVNLLGVELAGVAGLDDGGCILKHRRLVEATPEDLACEGARGGMMTALSTVDVVDELATFVGRDAPRGNPIGALTIQVLVVETVGLGLASNPLSLCIILGENSVL